MLSAVWQMIWYNLKLSLYKDIISEVISFFIFNRYILFTIVQIL